MYYKNNENELYFAPTQTVIERKKLIAISADEFNLILQPTLEDAKVSKLAELAAGFEAASKAAHCLSSAGFEINADEVANRNIEGLVLVLAEEESTLFRAYDNRFHEVTKEQLETMRKEIVLHSQRLYQQKWDYEKLIDSASTVDELNTIHISFEEVNDAKEKVHG